jgi:hypothetical protein
MRIARAHSLSIPTMLPLFDGESKMFGLRLFQFRSRKRDEELSGRLGDEVDQAAW